MGISAASWKKAEAALGKPSCKGALAYGRLQTSSDMVIPGAALHCVLPVLLVAAMAQTRLTAPAGLSLTPGFNKLLCYTKAAS